MKLRIVLMASLFYVNSVLAMNCENVQPIDATIHKALSDACDRLEKADVQFLIKVASSIATLFVPYIGGNIDRAADGLRTCCRQVRKELEDDRLGCGGSLAVCENMLSEGCQKLFFIKKMLEMWFPSDADLDPQLAGTICQISKQDFVARNHARYFLREIERLKAAIEKTSSIADKNKAVLGKLINKFNVQCLSLQIQLRYRPDLSNVSYTISQLTLLAKDIQLKGCQ